MSWLGKVISIYITGKTMILIVWNRTVIKAKSADLISGSLSISLLWKSNSVSRQQAAAYSAGREVWYPCKLIKKNRAVTFGQTSLLG